MRGRGLVGLLALAFLTRSPSPAAATPESELPSAWRALTVGLLHLPEAPPADPNRIFEASSTREPQGGSNDRVAYERVAEVLASALTSRDLVSAIPSERLVIAWTGRREVETLLARMDDHHRRGATAWRALQAKEAVAELDEALRLADEALADLVAPERVAEIAFLRGLALVEIGDAESARTAFESTLRLAPGRRFERGYYGDAVDEALSEAASLVATRRADMGSLERLGVLADTLGLGHLFVTRIARAAASRPDGTARAAVLEVAVFDARTRRLTEDDAIPLASFGAASEPSSTPLIPAFDDRLDRLVGRWHTCAIEALRRIGKPRPAERWSFDFGYRHSVWLEHRRTRDFLHGPGAQLTLSYAAARGLDLWARTAQSGTLRDGNGDLLDVFATTRFAIGVGLNVGNPWLRFLLRASIDTAISLSDIAATTDVDCKFFGPDSARCRSIFRAESPALWLGIEFSLGLRYAPTRSWYGVFETGVTSYVLSPSVIDELNFPLYGSLGFGLPF